MAQEEDWEKYNDELFKSLLLEETINDNNHNHDHDHTCNHEHPTYTHEHPTDENCCVLDDDIVFISGCCNDCNVIIGGCKGCVGKLSLLDPESQYQRLKIIQNTVRVPASLYSMNIGALTVYQRPGLMRVNWNQMSDRTHAHMQRSSMSMRSSVSVRPGNISPGGIGCDIKHNSYNRYIAKLKGKKPLRREIVGCDYGGYIPFNMGFPIYGGKTVKTSIGSTKCEICNEGCCCK